MLQKRDQTGGHRHCLRGRRVDVVNFVRRSLYVTLFARPATHLRGKTEQLVNDGPGLSDEFVGLFVGIEVHNIFVVIGDVRLHLQLLLTQAVQLLVKLFVNHCPSVRANIAPGLLLDNPCQSPADDLLLLDLVRYRLPDFPVRRLDEAVLVDLSESRKRTEQPDVGTFRSLYRADTPIVRVVHVSDIETCPVARETARTQRGEPALVGQLRKRIGLVHELRQLRAAEELLQRRGYRADVDQRRRRRLRRMRRHPVLDYTLHPHQTSVQLVLDQLTYRPHSPVLEVVYVVRLDLVAIDSDQPTH